MKQHVNPAYDEETERVQDQHDFAALTTREDRQSCHFDPADHLVPFLKQSIARIKLPRGIIGDAGHHMHVVSLFRKMKGHIVAPECLRIEVLADKSIFFFSIVL